MRLHHMIECISEAEASGIARPSPQMKEHLPGKMPSEIMREWCGHPTIEFGDAAAIGESVGTVMIDYANELAKNGILRLPFPRVIISFNASDFAYIPACA